ncbi:glyoxylate reductase [Psychrobacillus psychrotolerans]|uniref:Glyoxylate reductase n=1 Tax=Psychrobacillus psychrotolerans TaxID=126156 RepID=A0A1I5Y4D8_9BACI|nr:D-glycerate dehydrogenase [Psychrobacillus psychrotolerans]SFQ38970.1 glyoxylate reductase [Psychrobacillus psychrotolerans]
MKKIYITRKLPEEIIEPLRKKFDVQMWHSETIGMTNEEIITNAKDAYALWTMLSDNIDRTLIEGLPNLKVISNFAVGYNNIDIEAAKDRSIVVTNTPGVLTETTADLAFALLLATARRITEVEQEIRSGNWDSWSPMQYTGMDIFGATLGIVGMGRIGEAVARRAKGFDMNVLYHNRSRKLDAEETYGFTYAELDELLKQSDFVILLTPLTPETKGLIGERELNMMKETAAIINVARGGIVDEQALYEALASKKIWAAGLDVFEQEPVPVDHPLLTLPNVTVSPHIGSASIRTRQAMMQMNAKDIEAVLENREPQNRIL